MVNIGIVNRLLNNLDAYLKQLEDATDIDHEKYIHDIRSQRFVERTLQIAVEVCMDISHHIISDERFREPDTYSDAFSVLFENKIITSKTAEKCKKMAEFRNKLTHYYEKIDSEQVFTIFKQHLSDFHDFRKEINKWVNN